MVMIVEMKIPVSVCAHTVIGWAVCSTHKVMEDVKGPVWRERRMVDARGC